MEAVVVRPAVAPEKWRSAVKVDKVYVDNQRIEEWVNSRLIAVA
jgi:hypothetical protein